MFHAVIICLQCKCSYSKNHQLTVHWDIELIFISLGLTSAPLLQLNAICHSNFSVSLFANVIIYFDEHSSQHQRLTVIGS